MKLKDWRNYNLLFYVGLHQPSDAKNDFQRCFISVNRLLKRKSNFVVKDWILYSGAFTQVKNYGDFILSTEDYINLVNRWSICGNLKACVSQDYLYTGITSQKKSVERYKSILKFKCNTYVIPVLHGNEPEDYLKHLSLYNFFENQYVGVGSLVPKSSNPDKILNILAKIKEKRPDLKIHGFGLKLRCFKIKDITELLHSSDSMVWSFNARKYGGQNDWNYAKKFYDEVNALC